VAQGGTSTAPARKAKAVLTQVDTREVSTVDRPAIGETFVIVKNEGGVTTKKAGAAPVKKTDGATAETTPGVKKPGGEPDAPAAIESATKEEDGEEVAMALPPDAKSAIIAGLSAASDRIADLLTLVSGATEDPAEGAEVPGDYLVKVLDVAGGIAKLVEPFAKGHGIVDDTEKATWSTADIDKLPDSSFLHVEGGGTKDAEGKTTPRSLRHFPVKDADGKADLPHLRNAIDQAPKSSLPDDVKAHVQAEGRKLLETAEKAVTKADGKQCQWTQEYIDSLSDWCFLDVTPSMDRDTEYRTLPLSNRHFPVRDHSGRMCLAAVLDACAALATPSPAMAPWLTESRRLQLLLHLACQRLDEVTIPIRRDGMSPESSGELTAIAQMLDMVASAAAPAPAAATTPAPGATAEAGKAGENPMRPGEQPIGTEGAPTSTPTGGDPPRDVPTLAQKAASMFRAIAKGAQVPMAPEHHATLKEAHACMTKAIGALAEAGGHMEKCFKAVDPFFEGKVPDATADNPTGAQARPADLASAPADARTQKALADVATLRKALDQANADKAALRARIAKAERAIPASGVNRDEPEARPAQVAKNHNLPLSMDLNEVIAKADADAKTPAQPTAAQR
jgi:hypothetical protein